ncbi:LacI family DNA-binding transcriptional regulator [Solitalea koreensis]|uniref:Transcriptional regulator, LacI family n=1 Tax=Solitalea koreensis TaxID=543615 RepID=A0A521CXN9_9SPHI|nr:LacI family DNA-binding transcriptional regulator [Solitalea koreensis]SMO64188.1 transcriptional regulator, LacI family [Solitalea koreensis]
MKREKPPTIKEIAKKLKISTSTVSRALHNHPSIGYITTLRVHKMAEELNYQPNQTAISFKQRKTYTIGVLLPNLSEAFFSTAISGIEEFAEQQKYNVLMGQSLDDPEREKRVLETMKTHRVDGMIVSISKNTDNYDHFDQLKKVNIPIVFFDRIPEKNDIHYTACNLELGLINAMVMLVKRGHTKIALINGPEKLLASNQRLEAYKKGLDENNIEVDKRFIVSSDLSKEGNQKAMKKLLALKSRPTAVITFNDYLALDAMAVAKENQLVINEDISFVSFANLPIWAYMDSRPLASIEQFPFKQGEKAAEILFSILKESSNEESIELSEYQQVIFDSELVTHG